MQILLLAAKLSPWASLNNLLLDPEVTGQLAIHIYFIQFAEPKTIISENLAQMQADFPK